MVMSLLKNVWYHDDIKANRCHVGGEGIIGGSSVHYFSLNMLVSWLKLGIISISSFTSYSQIMLDVSWLS